jgi:hypothetical protein
MLRLVLVAVLVVGCGKSRSQEAARIGSGRGSGPAAAAPTKSPVDPKIAAFWTWFSQHAAELHADKDLEHTMLRIGDELAKVDTSLIAEVGELDGKRDLVITADGHKELFPRVKEVYAARPTSVDGWNITAFRQRDTRIDGFSIEMGKQSINAKSVKFVASRAGDKLDIEVFVPGFTTMDEMGAVAYLLLDHTVGEYDMETKIGGIDIAGIDKAPVGAKPLVDLPAAVDAIH